MKYLLHHAIAIAEFHIAHSLDVFIEKLRARAEADGLDDDEVEDAIADLREHTEAVLLPEARARVREIYQEAIETFDGEVV